MESVTGSGVDCCLPRRWRQPSTTRTIVTAATMNQTSEMLSLQVASDDSAEYCDDSAEYCVPMVNTPPSEAVPSVTSKNTPIAMEIGRASCREREWKEEG